MKTGLTLGKFAPLHKGHQLLIERAISQTDHVIVIVYDAPDVTTVPLPVRSAWIRKLYPSVEVLQGWDGPTEVGDTPEIMKIQEDYLLEFLAGRRITHFFSSEFYGGHVSRALGAEDCRVDVDRSTIPISGTAIRNNPFGNRQFIPGEVYWDLVTRIVLLGAPATGKTSLAKALACDLNTIWMPEYGREYWEKNQKDRRLTCEQLVEIAEGHTQREDAKALEANRFLFVDTDATTTYMFSLYYHGEAHPRLADTTPAVDTISSFCAMMIFPTMTLGTGQEMSVEQSFILQPIRAADRSLDRKQTNRASSRVAPLRTSRFRAWWSNRATADSSLNLV